MNRLSLMILCLCLLTLCACGQTDENVLVEKTGIKYELAQNDSFYYPKDFKMNLDRDLTNSISFYRDHEVIKYQKVLNEDDNLLEDLPLLYEGELEQSGANKVSYIEKEIDSGLKCYEYTGIYESSGIYFKHMVYFTDEASYVLSYEASKELFDKNIEDISMYLNSLVISK